MLISLPFQHAGFRLRYYKSKGPTIIYTKAQKGTLFKYFICKKKRRGEAGMKLGTGWKQAGFRKAGDILDGCICTVTSFQLCIVYPVQL